MNREQRNIKARIHDLRTRQRHLSRNSTGYTKYQELEMWISVLNAKYNNANNFIKING
jgi:hypothetical protein